YTSAGKYVGVYWFRGQASEATVRSHVERHLLGLDLISLEALKRGAVERQLWAGFSDLSVPSPTATQVPRGAEGKRRGWPQKTQKGTKREKRRSRRGWRFFLSFLWFFVFFVAILFCLLGGVNHDHKGHLARGGRFGADLARLAAAAHLRPAGPRRGPG